MLTIATLGAGSERYYLRSSLEYAIDEYYVRGEDRGHWIGEGCRGARLVGRSHRPRTWQSGVGRPVASGWREPRGRALGKRRPGFDFTFSAPKGVSLIGLLGDPATYARGAGGHDSAVARALGYFGTKCRLRAPWPRRHEV